jgi:hypothetical protein
VRAVPQEKEVAIQRMKVAIRRKEVAIQRMKVAIQRMKVAIQRMKVAIQRMKVLALGKEAHCTPWRTPAPRLTLCGRIRRPCPHAPEENDRGR